MSGDTLRPSAQLTDDNFSASIGGVGVSVKTGMLRGFFAWLSGIPASAWLAVVVMMTINLAVSLLAAWYVAGTAIPLALGIINDGHAARDAAHSKDLDKVIAAFKEESLASREHTKQILEGNREMLNLIRDDRKPIAVNPLGAGT